MFGIMSLVQLEKKKHEDIMALELKKHDDFRDLVATFQFICFALQMIIGGYAYK
jgi:hypothetical protein